MPGRLQFDFTFGKISQDRMTPEKAQDTMRILLMGDFSGRGGHGVFESDKLDKRRIHQVDIDNFSAIMKRIAPQLNLSLSDSTESDIEISFSQLDDFHPDQLYANLDLFRHFHALRLRLEDSKTFPQAAAELQRVVQLQNIAQQPDASNNATPDRNAIETDDALLERILGTAQGDSRFASGRQTQSKTIIQQFIRDIAAPYSEPKPEPFQDQYIAAIDDAISQKMRTLLHHPQFQALEALWRSVNSLVHGLETDSELKLYILDISKQELSDDIKATQGQLEQSQFYQLLMNSGAGMPGGEAWSTLVGAYTFTLDDEDISLLASLGAIGSQCGGPFVSAADAGFLGCQSVVNTPDPKDWRLQDNETVQNWQTLRQDSLASWIGLVLPRVLLRLPYGKETEPLDSFAFEEIIGSHDHENFLWGNPAFACAQLIGSTYQLHDQLHSQLQKRPMQLGEILEIDNLPAFTYDDDGETTLLACAEVFLSDRSAEAILDRGLMPLMSYRNRNAVRLMRFQSIAKPLKALAGPWA